RLQQSVGVELPTPEREVEALLVAFGEAPEQRGALSLAALRSHSGKTGHAVTHEPIGTDLPRDPQSFGVVFLGRGEVARRKLEVAQGVDRGSRAEHVCSRP